MTTTIPSPTTVLPDGRLIRHYRQSFGRVIRFEWIKFRTLRASWVGQALLVALLIGFSALAAAMSNNRMGDTGRAGRFAEMGPVATVLTGANLGVLVVGVLGCILGAREYGSRMIASTVAAVPRRWQVVLSKAVVLTAVLLVSTLVGVFGAFFLGMSVLHSGGNHTAALGDPGVLRQVVGMAGYLTAAGLLGMGLGVLLRSVAGSIGVLIAGLLVLPQLAGALLPASWDPALKYLPSSSAAAFTTIDRAGTDVLSSGAGAAVLVVWVLAVVGGAVWAISRRDV
ncbi:hypothetical protein [Cellulomonas sp. NTE-D12]|uniref:hypothetical protein n=1 Tax=Cellulomonas sp. NTE-D12 TaxID=2962632 RepID=UPI003081B0E4|nr:ABC transporter permease [Cellulomonas sp. NTE-D12]